MSDHTVAGHYDQHHRCLAQARLPILDDLMDYDDHAGSAMQLRRSAFHDAGHLWAAHSMGLVVTYPDADGVRPIDIGSLGVRQCAFVGAAGPLAAATLDHLDYTAEAYESLDGGSADTGDILTVAMGFGIGDLAVCEHRVCSLAARGLSDADEAATSLDRVLEDWQTIFVTASLLIAATPVSNLEIDW